MSKKLDPFMPSPVPQPPSGTVRQYRVLYANTDWRFDGKRRGSVRWFPEGYRLAKDWTRRYGKPYATPDAAARAQFGDTFVLQPINEGETA